ncbi:DNA-binding protein, partial [bacterium 1XD42-8]
YEEKLKLLQKFQRIKEKTEKIYKITVQEEIRQLSMEIIEEL